MPNFKGSDLGRVPFVSADFWTSDHRSERSRSVGAVSETRARGKLTLKRRGITLVPPRRPRARVRREVRLADLHEVARGGEVEEGPEEVGVVVDDGPGQEQRAARRAREAEQDRELRLDEAAVVVALLLAEGHGAHGRPVEREVPRPAVVRGRAVVRRRARRRAEAVPDAELLRVALLALLALEGLRAERVDEDRVRREDRPGGGDGGGRRAAVSSGGFIGRFHGRRARAGSTTRRRAAR